MKLFAFVCANCLALAGADVASAAVTSARATGGA